MYLFSGVSVLLVMMIGAVVPSTAPAIFRSVKKIRLFVKAFPTQISGTNITSALPATTLSICLCIAVGKVLLSHLNKDLQNSLVSQMKFVKKTPNSITSKEEFLKELNEIKNAPYCEQYEQFLFGHADIAVPVYDDSGNVISAIGIACTPENLKEKHELIVKTLLDFSSMLSRKLGYYPNSTLTTSVLSKK